MATYFVEINAHFLVKIEIEGSCATAEHHFLDNYHWIWAANAYDEKSMKTECFRGALLCSEIVSENELADRLNQVCKADCDKANASAEYHAADLEVKRLERELEAAKERAAKAFRELRIKESNFVSLCEENCVNRPA